MRVFACSDLHGNGKLWDAIKAFLKPDDKLIYLGDATDRGPDGWRILKEMINDDRVEYLAGNHDIMLRDRLRNRNDYWAANLHNSNGGITTWMAAEDDPEAHQIMLAICQMPLYTVYENKDGLKIFLSHSGSTEIDSEEALTWDRTEYVTSKNYTAYNVIVHGHTTIPHLIKDLKECYEFYEKPAAAVPEWEGGAYWYHGFRCDIDCCTIRTNQTVLLDLDTFDEEIFEV
jgi:predicted phosphodiesterase